MDKVRYFEGLEIGAVSVKWVRRTSSGQQVAEVARHEGDPRKKVEEIFARHAADADPNVVITGQAARALLDLPYRSETECIERALAYHDLRPDLVLSLGGETFIVYTVKNGRISNIIASSKCAAGTGEFIVQQFQRMGLGLEDGIRAGSTGSIVPLATRCSVHCKSDATHRLNKGECTPGDIARTLIADLAKKVHKMIELAQWPTDTIVVSGGVGGNGQFMENLRQGLPDSDLRTIEESRYLAAFGASLLAGDGPRTSAAGIPGKAFKKIPDASFERLQPLRDALPLLDYRAGDGREAKPAPGASYVLGVDAGSTTTKAVLYNLYDGSIGARAYLRTHGNPVAAAKNCLREILKQTGGTDLRIIQAAVTGSGREMVSVYLGGCLSFNEILAHARAAAEEVPDVDTVFEIGGQDSKFISFLNGVPIDYAMNEGCSAGTGSFLEESVSVDMGIPVQEIGSRALASGAPIAFGERCAAFINTDLRNALQQGAAQDDVIAGLVYSIADNYISRIVGVRTLGSHILFQGGVALNKPVALAMAARTGKRITVPRHPELMGCVGTALMTMDLLKDGHAEKQDYRLEDLLRGDMEVKNSFRCPACDSTCEIQIISIRDKKYPFGGFCSKYEIRRHRGRSIHEGTDFVAERTKILFDEFGPEEIKHPLGTIGVPMALTTFEYFPFYAKLINGLGYNAVLSGFSRDGNEMTKAAMCYPCEIAHGAVYDLTSKNTDFILMPYVLEGEIQSGSMHGYFCPTTAVMPGILKNAFTDTAGKLLSPHIGFSGHLQDLTLKEIGDLAAKLHIGKRDAVAAAKEAFAQYGDFRKKYRTYGTDVLKKISREPAVIIAGRPYITCYAAANLSLPRKITSRGYHAVPADMLPVVRKHPYDRDVWHFTQQIMNAVSYAKSYAGISICLVSCFSCGPDASMYHIVREQLAGHTFCYLEIDSHTAHAGFDTRVGAFLDIMEEKRRKGIGTGKPAHKAAVR